MLDYGLEKSAIGGLRLRAHKNASTQRPITRLTMPRQLVVAIEPRSGQRSAIAVSPGERVLRGQPIVEAPQGPERVGAHAPTSGLVSAIESRLVLCGSELAERPCIVIDTDGRDEPWRPGTPHAWPVDRTIELDRVRAAGIVGLGGAAFPTATKLATRGQCRAMIINGAECEPYISCDDMLMRRSPTEIVAGALLLADLAAAPQCIIAIERDKPAALEAIKSAAATNGDERLRVAEIPSVYPTGGERQLIEMLTGSEVPSGEYPSHVGYVCQNVGTAFAVYRLAAAGEPLISRIVTVTGRGVAEPRNVEALIGTPIAELVAACGGYRDEVAHLVVGGSMMGIGIPDDSLPVTKSTNCVIAAAASELGDPAPEWPCIRCGDCAAACPARLMPQELLRAARSNATDELAHLGLADCIECGCCDAACPSHIRLTARFKSAKHAYDRYVRDAASAELAQQRFDARERRLAAREAQGRDRQDDLIGELGDSASERARAIEAAVERAGRKRRDSAESR